MALALLALLGPAHAAPLPDSPRVSMSIGTWGYREGVGTRFRLTDAASVTTSLAPFRTRVGFVSNTGLELHPLTFDLGHSGWLVPTLGLGALSTGGVPGLHASPVPGTALYAAPGVRWVGPRARTATILGVTARHQVQGQRVLDVYALSLAVEYTFRRTRTRSARPMLPETSGLPD